MSEPAPGQTTPSAADQTQAIEAALERIDSLRARPLSEHAEAFEELHTALTDALSSIDPSASDGV